MTWFTDSPFEKMMTQKPGHGRRRDDTPPVPHSPACISCPYNKGQAPCVGYCIKKLQEKRHTEPGH